MKRRLLHRFITTMLFLFINLAKNNGALFIAMPFLEGNTLSDLISSVSKLSTKASLKIAYDLTKGVSAAHDKGLLHRDIKPANIWIESKTNRAILLDFGLSRSLTGDGLTQTGQILGTPAYMSPEQIQAGKIDCRSDLFSVGIVLYESLTGISPFKRPNVLASLSAIATIPVTGLSPKRRSRIESHSAAAGSFTCKTS